MEGAAERQRHERAVVWWGAMLPHMKKPPTFREFVGGERGLPSEVAACVEAWDRIDRALSRNRKAA